jgi:general secretion pathway protein D
MKETVRYVNPPRKGDFQRRRAGLLALSLTFSAGTVLPALSQTPAPKPPNGTPAPKPATTPGTPVSPAAPAPAKPAVLAAASGAGAGMIKLDFRGTDIDQVLQAFALAYKWTVVKDPALTGPVTVIETTPMDQQRAFKVLQAILEVRGFTALLDGTVLKIMPVKRAITSSTTVRVTDTGASALDRNQVVTEVVPLSNAEAGSLAKDLEPLLTDGAKIIGASGANALIITDVASNVERLKLIIGALDRGAGNNEMQIFRLKHVPAKKMTEIINNLFKQIAPRSPGAPAGQPGQPPQIDPRTGQPLQGGGKEARPAVAAVDDERTNSVIVVGSAENLKRVGDVVKKLDDELNPHTETRTYEVKFADAQKLAQLVYDALLADPGKSGQTQQQAGFINPFERRAQGTDTTSFSAGQTRIVADTRTNSLVITADEDTMNVVEDLLAKLDKAVEYETTTFSIPLKNTNADDMAYVLQQAFGEQTGGGNGNPFFGGFFGGNSQKKSEDRRDRRIPRRLNDDKNDRSDSRLGGAGMASLPTGGFRPGDPAGTRLADAGMRPELPPGAEQLAQFYYDPYNRRGNQGSQATTGRNTSGRYVNLLQLRGNVLVTPERNTNSLIITTSPENAEAVRKLVSELDVETKQVLMEAIVAEVSLDKTTKFGIDYLFKDSHNMLEGIFPVLPSTGAIGVDALAAGLRATIIRGNVQGVVTALAQDQKINILSTPRIFTANNQQAEIEVTDRLPYLSGTTVGFGGQTQTSVDFISVGLILNVTPRITADGMVTVDVYQEDSNLVEFRNVGNNAQAPLTTQRVTDTSVTLKDGDTLVLSGLQKNSRTNSKNKIPLLGDLPVLGNLFRSTTKQNQKTELVVFLTPRVLNNADEARSVGQQELKRIQKRIPDAKTRLPELPKPEGEPSVPLDPLRPGEMPPPEDREKSDRKR